MTNDIIYSDIDLDFTQTTEGDVKVIYNLDAIKQSIKNIILSPHGSRTIYQDPYFGCGVFKLLFEKMSSVTEILIQEEIESALNNYEPRIEIIELNVEGHENNNFYEVLIKYRVLAINIEDELTIDLEILK